MNCYEAYTLHNLLHFAAYCLQNNRQCAGVVVITIAGVRMEELDSPYFKVIDSTLRLLIRFDGN